MKFDGFTKLGYISFETAKALIDKHTVCVDTGYNNDGVFASRIGQDGECIWFDNGLKTWSQWDFNYEEKLIPAPELFYVQKWLRDEKGTNVYCVPSSLSSAPNCWTWIIVSMDDGVVTELEQSDHCVFDSYEVSLDKGLLEALKLIK